MSNFLQPHGLQLSRLLCPCNSSGKNRGVDCLALLQGLFPTQGLNLGLPQCWQILYHPSHQGSPICTLQFSSVQFIRSVMSDSLWPHELQHARPPCPSPTPRVHLNPYSLSRWRHPTISSSVVPFSSCPQSFPASGSFQMSQLFAWGGQSIGVLASTSVLPMNTQVWSPLGCTGWISLQSKRLSRVFPNTTVQSINSSVLRFLYSPTLTSIHNYWENHSFD